MKKHIKDAWLKRLTPEWWETRTKGRLRNGKGLCATGVLMDVIDSTRWNGNIYIMPNGEEAEFCFPYSNGRWSCENIGLPAKMEEQVAIDNDRNTYEELLAAVHAIPEDA